MSQKYKLSRVTLYDFTEAWYKKFLGFTSDVQPRSSVKRTVLRPHRAEKKYNKAEETETNKTSLRYLLHH